MYSATRTRKRCAWSISFVTSTVRRMFSPRGASSGYMVSVPSDRGVKTRTSPAWSPRWVTQLFGSEMMNVEPPVFWIRRPWNPPVVLMERRGPTEPVSI